MAKLDFYEHLVRDFQLPSRATAKCAVGLWQPRAGTCPAQPVAFTSLKHPLTQTQAHTHTELKAKVTMLQLQPFHDEVSSAHGPREVQGTKDPTHDPKTFKAQFFKHYSDHEPEVSSDPKLS